MSKITNFEELAKRVEELRASGTADLSTEEDLSIAIMNLISLEEHFYFTAEKTGKEEYFSMMNEAREMRKQMLARMITNTEGEVWCISKHLLAATMRLWEVGTKLYSSGDKEDGKKMFNDAYKLYSMFWALRLGAVSVPDIKQEKQPDGPWSYQDIVNKLVDCCKE